MALATNQERDKRVTHPAFPIRKKQLRSFAKLTKKPQPFNPLYDSDSVVLAFITEQIWISLTNGNGCTNDIDDC